jgi:hypothetical protein
MTTFFIDSRFIKKQQAPENFFRGLLLFRTDYLPHRD